MKNPFRISILFAALISTHSIVLAANSTLTVDQADSLNYDRFHDQTNTQEAMVKTDLKAPWDPTDTKALNAFETEKGGVKTYSNTGKDGTLTPPPIAKPGQTFEKGQRINIRALYQPSGSPTVLEATQDLHQQMANFCPQGFAKHGEWSKLMPDSKQFYLYYQFECLSM